MSAIHRTPGFLALLVLAVALAGGALLVQLGEPAPESSYSALDPFGLVEGLGD